MELDKLLDELLLDEEISSLVKKYNLSREFLHRNLPTLMTQVERNKICRECKGNKICLKD